MKRMVWIGIVVFLVVAACARPDDDPVETRFIASPTIIVSPELSAIDSLMWRQPDSALALLLPYFDTCCRDVSRNVSRIPNVLGDVSGNVSTTTEHDNHYAHLLLSELLYKNDYEQTNRRDLQKAVNYFDSLTLTLNDTPSPKRLIAGKDPLSLTRNGSIAFLDARSHYINGVGYYENDSVVEACKEYLKAWEIMENHFKDKDLISHKAQFMALTYTRLSMLFSDMYLHEQAIYFAQLSIATNQKLDVPRWHIARMLCEIGVQYDIMEQLDSADFYYKNATIVLSDTNSLLFRDIFTRQVFLSYKKKGLEESTLTQLDFIMSQSNSETEYLLRSLTKGEVFYQEKQLDSAWYYLNKVYNNTKSIASKKQAAEWLLDISKNQRKDDEIHEYANFLAPFANQEENQSEIKSQLTELYNSFRQAHLSRQHQQMVKKYMTIGLVVLVGLLVGLLAYVFLYHKNKRRKRLLEKQIKEEQFSLDMKQKALSGRLKKSNEEVRKLKGQIKQMDDLVAKSETAISFNEEPICCLIMERVKEGRFKSKIDHFTYKDFALEKQQLLDLRLAVDRHFGQFTVRLKKSYPELTNSDLDYCCLYLLSLTDADVAALMQRAYNTVVERDGKIKKILGSNNPLPYTLTAIANESLFY